MDYMLGADWMSAVGAWWAEYIHQMVMIMATVMAVMYDINVSMPK